MERWYLFELDPTQEDRLTEWEVLKQYHRTLLLVGPQYAH